ncbi:MAG TPA: hypothetical protein VK400_15140 [Pyrinomonadaceae bacterium]|nr:hypothetical protein [Pyrinomonadaceae bacterium]
MNSEELEQSLRTEFESYLKTVLAETRQEMSQLQESVEAEIEKHKAQLDQVFQDAFTRLNADRGIDLGFRESVVEHLRLARDEGARITATAIAEAEEMEKQKAAEAPPKAGFAELREAINEISSKASQSEILKSLVNHAANFAPRGAFFVVKNEHFVGWRKFGNEKGENEEAIREVYLPASADSILSEATRSLATVESSAETYSADAAILEKLEFGSPERMYAIPLVARGRGVAVLYADYGNEGAHLDTDALETLVKVAGLTVELLASAKPVSRKKSSVVPAVAPTVQEMQEASFEQPQSSGGYEEYPAPAVSESSYGSQPQTAYQTSFESEPSYQAGGTESHGFVSESYAEQQPPPQAYFQEATPAVESYQPVQPFEQDSQQQQESFPTYDDSSWNQPQPVTGEYATDYSPEDSAGSRSGGSDYAPDYSFQPSVEQEPQVSTNEYQFETSQSFESTPPAEAFENYAQPSRAEAYAPAPVQEETSFGSSFETVADKSQPTQNGFGDVVETAGSAAPQSAQAAAPVRTRFSERNVDLPIEVTEDERRLHNDARRFARLLVSEIKLYNEQKVKEGREANDLYERLREAIDRSREMYDKRVQPSVAAKFDYFHYELVSSLGDGEESKLGTSYPGATV